MPYDFVLIMTNTIFFIHLTSQSKHQKHQAFEAELAANADRLQALLSTGNSKFSSLVLSFPTYFSVVCPTCRFSGSASAFCQLSSPAGMQQSSRVHPLCDCYCWQQKKYCRHFRSISSLGFLLSLFSLFGGKKTFQYLLLRR